MGSPPKRPRLSLDFPDASTRNPFSPASSSSSLPPPPPGPADRLPSFLDALRLSTPSSVTTPHQPLPAALLDQAFKAFCDNYAAVQYSLVSTYTPLSVVVTQANTLFDTLVNPLAAHLQSMVVERDSVQTQIHALEAKLEAERTDNNALRAQLEAERTDNNVLRSQLEAERSGKSALSTQLEAERTRAKDAAELASEISIKASGRADNLAERIHLRERVNKQEKALLRQQKDVAERERNLQKENFEQIIAVLKDTVEKTSTTCLYFRNRLERMQEAPVRIVGSATRAATWDSVLNLNTTQQNETLPLHDSPALHPHTWVTVDRLEKRKFSTEMEMYEPIITALQKALGNASSPVRVFNSHGRHFLEGFAPDITLVAPAAGCPDPSSTHTVIEVKKDRLDGGALGQAYDYLAALHNNQPHRRFVFSVLTNIQENYVLLMDKDRVIHHKSVSFADLVRYILHVLPRAGYQPPSSLFSSDLGPFEGRLGRPRASMAAKFAVPEALEKGEPSFEVGRVMFSLPPPPSSWSPSSARHKVMAVKRSCIDPSGDFGDYKYHTAISEEIKALTRIASRGGHLLLPRILFHSTDLMELATLPVGRPLNRADPASHVAGVLDDILEALVWLHAQNIVHRDVRWDNIIVVDEVDCAVDDVRGTNGSRRTGPRGVLIDLGAAYIRPAEGPAPKPTIRGGYVCIPPKHLVNPSLANYEPLPAHDFLSFLILVNVLLFPSTWNELRTSNIFDPSKDENHRLRNFWIAVEKSSFWKMYHAAAMECDVTTLRKLLDLCVWC